MMHTKIAIDAITRLTEVEAERDTLAAKIAVLESDLQAERVQRAHERYIVYRPRGMGAVAVSDECEYAECGPPLPKCPAAKERDALAADNERLRALASRCLLNDPPGDCYAAEVVALREQLATMNKAYDCLAIGGGELGARLAEAERLLRDCYSPVRRIAEGGSRTREDLERAEDTFARLKEFLS